MRLLLVSAASVSIALALCREIDARSATRSAPGHDVDPSPYGVLDASIVHEAGRSLDALAPLLDAGVVGRRQ